MSSNIIVMAFILFLLILLFYKTYVQKEHLAPMLKKALGGNELSYKSNVGPGYTASFKSMV